MTGKDFLIKIGGVLDPSLKKSFNVSSKELKKLGEDMKDMKKKERYFKSLKNSSLKLENSFQSVRQEYKKQQNELWLTSEKVRQLKNQISKVPKPSKAMIKELKKAKQAEDRLRQSTTKQKKELASKLSEMKRAKNETKKYADSQDDLAKSMEKVRIEQEKLRKHQGYKKSVIDGADGTFNRSLAQGTAIGVALKFAVDEEEAFSDVRKALDFEDKIEMESFKKKLKEETKDIPVMVDGIFEIAAAAGQAGIDKLEIPKFTADTSKVSVAFDLDAGSSGEILATWRESFKMNQKEVMVLADQMNLLSNEIKVQPGQVAELTTTIGTLGKMANFTEAKTAALGGTLIALGVKDASTASTALRRLYGTLASGEAATGTVSEAFKRLGLDAVQVSKDLQKDSEKTLIQVFENIKKLDKADQLSVTKQLFGEEGLASMGLLIDNTKFLAENLKLVGDSSKYTNSVNDEYINKMDTTKTELKLLGKTLASAANDLTNTLLPGLRAGSKVIGGFASGLSKLSETAPYLVDPLVHIGTAFVGLKLGVSGTVLGLKAISKTKNDLVFLKDTAMLVKDWKKLGPVLNGLKGNMISLGTMSKASFLSMKASAISFGTAAKAQILGLTASMKAFALANPYLLGITAAIVAGYLLYKNWDWIKEKGLQMKDALIGGFVEIKDSISNTWSNLKSGFSEAYKFIVDKMKTMFNIWKKSPFGILYRTGEKLYNKYNENKKDIPAYAKGGIVNKPHLAIIGDASESIIPHNGSSRSRNLWIDAGKRIGAIKDIPKLASRANERLVSSSLSNISVEAPISITINGDNSNVIEEVKKLLEKHTEGLGEARKEDRTSFSI